MTKLALLPATLYGSKSAEGEGELIFSASGLEIAIDRKTGAWTRLVDKTFGRTLLASMPEDGLLSLLTGGQESRFPPILRPPSDLPLTDFQTFGPDFRVASHTITDEGNALAFSVTCKRNDWVVTVEYRVPVGIRRVERRFRIRYEGSGEVILRRMQVRLPVMLKRPGDLVERPIAAAPPSVPMESLAEKSVTLGDVRMLALQNPEARNAVLFCVYSETEFPVPEATAVSGEFSGLKPGYVVQLAARMKRGMELAWGSDCIWALNGEWFEVLEQFQRRWDELGVRTPADRPEWTERATLYETQIGAAIFERGAHQFNPYPTFQSLIDNLDYIQKLGFDTLQIMPRQPCPSYSVYDYFDPVHQYGDDAGLRALVKEAHRRGMRVILDWLLHGAMDKEIARKVYSMLDSADDEHKNTDLAQYVLTFAPAWIESAPEVNPLRAKHPEWFMRDLEGRFRYIYTWAFDLQNRELQDYIIDAMKFYVRDFDVDGFRVDAPIWNVFPNWDPKISYRPSLSMTGSIRLLDRARPALRRLKPELMLYTEPSGPMFRRMFDVNYSYDELWAMAELLQWRKAKNLHYRSGVFFPDMGSRKPLNAYQFRLWLENRRRAQPKGSVSIHQVDSHDSFWWPPFEFKFRRQQYGVEGFRALFFMMATLDGGLMHYPTGEQGSEEFVRRILTLRRELPEIKHGRCEYLKVLVSETAVFAVSWETPSGWAVPLTNLGQAKLSVRAGLPRERFGWNPDAAYVVRDVFGNKPVNGQQEAVLRGRELDNLRVTLEPLESALLVTRERRN